MEWVCLCSGAGCPESARVPFRSELEHRNALQLHKRGPPRKPESLGLFKSSTPTDRKTTVKTLPPAIVGNKKGTCRTRSFQVDNFVILFVMEKVIPGPK